MTHKHPFGFTPAALKTVCGAFDVAWKEVKDHASDANREAARGAVSKAIVGLARTGYSSICADKGDPARKNKRGVASCGSTHY